MIFILTWRAYTYAGTPEFLHEADLLRIVNGSADDRATWNAKLSPLSAGQAIIVSGADRYSAAAGQAEIGIAWYDAAGNFVSFRRIRKTGPAEDWATFAIRLTVPAGVYAARLYLRLLTAGVAEWQGVTVAARTPALPPAIVEATANGPVVTITRPPAVIVDYVDYGDGPFAIIMPAADTDLQWPAEAINLMGRNYNELQTDRPIRGAADLQEGPVAISGMIRPAFGSCRIGVSVGAREILSIITTREPVEGAAWIFFSLFLAKHDGRVYVDIEPRSAWAGVQFALFRSFGG